MAKKLKLRPTAWTVAVAVWDVWRRLPPDQRKHALQFLRKHSPKLAARVIRLNRSSKKKLKK